jgi:predicted small metal-binding protein
MDERRIRTRCACGWEASGPQDEVVEATIEHGLRLHNMEATPDQVLSQAEDAEAGDEPR